MLILKNKSRRRWLKRAVIAATTVAAIFRPCQAQKQALPANRNPAAYCSMNDFYTMDKIIIHVHIKTFDTAFIRQATQDNFRLLTINVNSPSSPPIEEQQETAVKLAAKYPGRVTYATTISVSNWDSADWQVKTLQYLKTSFQKGAIGVKVWKNIGMVLKDSAGRYVMIDHPKFDLIFDYIEKHNITLIGHLGEPKNCWLSVEQMTVNNDKRYFSTHPEYHMYLHPECPSYEDQIRARDHMLDKHPNLRFIGAHLGSLEWSVDELAKRLDKYPHMAVDLAARIGHLQYQAINNWQKVHDFLVKYQDRIIYATDQTVNGDMSADSFNSRAHQTWLQDWKFFTAGDKMKVPDVDGEFRAMKLPRGVIEKIYRRNAEKWLPGISKTLKKTEPGHKG